MPRSENKDSAPQESGLFEGNSWSLPSDMGLIEKAEGALGERLRNEDGFSDDDKYKILMTFREVLANAIAHGNLGLASPEGEGETLFEMAAKKHKELLESGQPDKYVKVDFEIVPGKEIKIVVKDEGKGFDWRAMPDPTEGEGLFRASGRGNLLARHFFDTVEFNDAGNEITLIKKLKSGDIAGGNS